MQERRRVGVAPDFERVFAAVPSALLLLDLDLRVVDANPAYCALLGRRRADLVGRTVFGLFPDNPDDATADGIAAVRASLEAARDTARTQVMPLQRYDIAPVDGGGFVPRYWSIINVPIVDEHGVPVLLLNRSEDVTGYVQRQAGEVSPAAGDWQERVARAEAEVYARSQEVREAWQAQAEASRRTAALANVSRSVAVAESVREVVELVISHGLVAMGADDGAIVVRSPDDTVELAITTTSRERSGAESARLSADGPLSRSPIVAADGQVLLPDRAASLAFAPEMAGVIADTGCQAWAALPLRAGRHVLGTLVVGWQRPHDFPTEELELLDAFAANCAQGLVRIRARQTERAIATADRRMAEALQLSLLTDPVQPDHLQIAVRYHPAADGAKIGGDWYDAFLTADNALSLAVGDVAGHDRRAAAAMGQLRNLLRGLAYGVGEPPAKVLSALDGALTHYAVGTFATVVLVQIEQTPVEAARGLRRAKWSSAGHVPPLLLHPDGRAELLDTQPDTLLGVDRRTARHNHETLLPVGSTLLLYTDGLVERRGSDLDQDLERLRVGAELFGGLDLEKFCDELINWLSPPGDDDVAVLALRAHDEAKPRPPEAGPKRLRP